MGKLFEVLQSSWRVLRPTSELWDFLGVVVLSEVCVIQQNMMVRMDQTGAFHLMRWRWATNLALYRILSQKTSVGCVEEAPNLCRLGMCFMKPPISVMET